MRLFKVKKYRFVQRLSFSPDSNELLALSGYESRGAERATTLDVTTGEPIRELAFVSEKFAIAADHSRLIVGGDAGSRSERFVHWCDPREAKPAWVAVKVGAGWPATTSCLMAWGLALARDCSTLYVAYGRHRFAEAGAEWSYFLAKCSLDSAVKAKPVPVENLIYELALSPKEDRFAAATRNEEDQSAVVLLDQSDGSQVGWFAPPGVRSGVGRLCYSPDGKYLAVVAARSIHLLAGDTLSPVAELTGFTKQVNSVAFSHDSRTLLSASHDGLIRIWDVATASVRSSFDWGIGPVTTVAFSPDGLLCAAAGNGGKIVIWDVD